MVSTHPNWLKKPKNYTAWSTDLRVRSTTLRSASKLNRLTYANWHRILCDVYCVTTLRSKTNTTANIGVKCLHFSHNVMGVSRMGKTRVVFIDPGTKVKSSYSILQYRPRRGSAAWHQSNMSSLQDGAPAHTATMDYLKKEHINFIEPHMWPPNSPDINPWISLFRVLFSNESTTDDNSRRWKNWSERYSRSGKTLITFHW